MRWGKRTTILWKSCLVGLIDEWRQFSGWARLLINICISNKVTPRAQAFVMRLKRQCWSGSMSFIRVLHQLPEKSLCVSWVCLWRTARQLLIHCICSVCPQILMSVRPRCITASPTRCVSTCPAAIAVTACQASSEWTNTPALVSLHVTTHTLTHQMTHWIKMIFKLTWTADIQKNYANNMWMFYDVPLTANLWNQFKNRPWDPG